MPLKISPKLASRFFRLSACNVAALFLAVCMVGIVAAWDTTPRPNHEQIQKLIVQLGDKDYFVRERAQQDLVKIGFEAFDALSDAENHDDIEIAARAKFLVRQMEIKWTVESDSAEVKRLLQNYALQDDAAHLATIEQLSELDDDKGLAVLCRLARFEKSVVLSKLAALAAIEGTKGKPAGKEIDWNRRQQVIDTSLGASSRPAAQWLRTFARAHSDRSGAADEWAKHAEAEEKAAQQAPAPMQQTFASALWRQRVTLLKQLDRRDDAVAAMMRIVALDDDNDSLLELVDWLARDKAWDAINDVAAKFADRFEQDPLLLYTLAQACKSQGNDGLAQQHAGKAVQLNEGNQFQHLRAAVNLQSRGLFDWSEREYRQAIKVGPPGQGYTLRGQFLLAEMLYDRADYQGAANTLEEAAKSFEGKAKEGLDEEIAGTERTGASVLARQHFFRSCQYEAAGQRDKQLAELKTGLEQDPSDVDVLIALFHMPGLEAGLREKTRKLIRDSAKSYREQMEETPDVATPYNQFAWLVANTEGDKQEALAASQKSLELQPGAAGYLDTLGRCYFAVGDLENAIRTQTKAVELDPHSGQMNRQLKVFQEALAKKKAEKK